MAPKRLDGLSRSDVARTPRRRPPANAARRRKSSPRQRELPSSISRPPVSYLGAHSFGRASMSPARASERTPPVRTRNAILPRDAAVPASAHSRGAIPSADVRSCAVGARGRCPAGAERPLDTGPPPGRPTPPRPSGQPPGSSRPRRTKRSAGASRATGPIQPTTRSAGSAGSVAQELDHGSTTSRSRAGADPAPTRRPCADASPATSATTTTATRNARCTRTNRTGALRPTRPTPPARESLVPRGRIELPTPRFSVVCSTD